MAVRASMNNEGQAAGPWGFGCPAINVGQLNLHSSAAATKEIPIVAKELGLDLVLV